MRIIDTMCAWFANTFFGKEPEDEYSIANCIAYNSPFLVSNTSKVWNFELGYASLCVELRHNHIICMSYRFSGCLLSHVIGDEDVIFITEGSTRTKKTCLKVSDLHGINFGLVLKESDLAYIRLSV